MTVVVDSNILIAYALADEPLHAHAVLRLTHWQMTQTPLAAPMLFRAELTAVLRKTVYQGRVTHEQGRLLLMRLLTFKLDLVDDDALLQSAYELAYRFNRPRAYDSLYMALAERLDCEFWTADTVLVNAVKNQYARIRWLGSIDSPES